MTATQFSINTLLGSTQALQKKLFRELTRPVVASKVVALDLDETAGSWGTGSLGYRASILFSKTPPPTALFVQSYMEKGGARPGLRQALETLKVWKEIGRIDEVAIFTSASNEDGWIDYLIRCMEEYAGTPGLFGRRLTREDSPEVKSSCGQIRTLKDLSLLSSDADSVVLIDDKPQYAINGRVIAVSEYCQAGFEDEMFEWICAEVPDHASEIQNALMSDRIQYPPSKKDFSGDTALWRVMTELEQVFPLCQS